MLLGESKNHQHTHSLHLTWIINNDYRGEIKVILYNAGAETFRLERGMRIAQLVVAPVSRAALQLVDQLSETARAEGGFGSTGSKIP